MARILISGLINIETTLRVDGFPLDYAPVHYAFDRVHSSVSGVGFNIAKALRTLGHEARLLSLIGRDAAATSVARALRDCSLKDDFVLSEMDETAQSVILYDADGKRQIHVDLKQVQERAYPPDIFDRALAGCDAAVLCNINFSRPFLERARAAGKLVATDVHALSDPDDSYNRDFMAGTDILFMSGDLAPQPPEEWAAAIMKQYGPRILVLALGASGALLLTQSGERHLVPAVAPRRIVNTIGAGDALFASFLHGYLECGDPLPALRQAVVFASHKIGAASASEGFLNDAELHETAARVYGPGWRTPMPHA